jgi:hypothetical protein
MEWLVAKLNTIFPTNQKAVTQASFAKYLSAYSSPSLWEGDRGEGFVTEANIFSHKAEGGDESPPSAL